ncbi:hypothetical protein K8374_13160 [Pseudomonas sp. p1(2021b)]|uniref:hypothetical protein n=1 Tax=Pseudomonas sp. p1(2021b) TaxID=2874628 RepID=UPI001CCB29DB|nr:hypothetical protein [Pseudomonas sp. p1(2021b)]UBM23352.1 hypothetical protein K8374_13160 [Pseudomonas sp. p1(2021b)]
MPTENRSNNADGWIACDDGLHLIQMDENLSHYGWVFRKVDGGLPYSVREATPHEMTHAQARQHLRIGVAQVSGQALAPQAHPEPIAWMVGTAFWWTKEEAERDAAATGLPIVGVGPMIDTAEVERLRDGISRHWKVVCDQRTELAKRDALLREIADHCNGCVMPTEQLLRDWGSSIDAALSVSVEPSTLPDPLRCNECTHANCGKFDGPRQVECRAMADNACARPGAGSQPWSTFVLNLETGRLSSAPALHA